MSEEVRCRGGGGRGWGLEPRAWPREADIGRPLSASKPNGLVKGQASTDSDLFHLFSLFFNVLYSIYRLLRVLCFFVLSISHLFIFYSLFSFYSLSPTSRLLFFIHSLLGLISYLSFLIFYVPLTSIHFPLPYKSPSIPFHKTTVYYLLSISLFTLFLLVSIPFHLLFLFLSFTLVFLSVW